jgi:hypothetical protein
MSATRYLKIPNVMTAITALVNTGIHVADKSSKRASKVNVKSPPKSSSNNSKTTGGSKRRRLTMRLNRSLTRYKMTGGAKEYTFDIGFGIQCKLIMHRPHHVPFGRTDYMYELKCNDEHFIQNQTVNDIKSSLIIPEYHLSKVIDKINNIIDNNDNKKDESEIVGLTKLRDVLKKKYSEIKRDKKDRISRAISYTPPKSHNTPSPDPKPLAVIPEGGSKRRRSVRRNRNTRRLRR